MSNFLAKAIRGIECWWKTGYVNCPPAAPELFDRDDDSVSDDDNISPDDLGGDTYGEHATAASHPEAAPAPAAAHPAQAAILHQPARSTPGIAPAPARMQHGIDTEIELQRLHQTYAQKPKPKKPIRSGPGPRRFTR